MTKNLTEGNPFSLIINFSVPVLLGYLFQQFYSVTDTIIVGKSLGVQALAAVGSTGSVSFLIIGFVVGVCSGFAIPVAQRFGANDFSTMRRYITNIAFLTVLFSIIMTVLTVIYCRPLLLLMQTPPDIVDRAVDYIRIIFAGIPLIFLYNMTASIIRSLGDSRTPVYFLVLSSVLNIALDLIFILICKWDVVGAALATVISQGIAGIACLIYMISHYKEVHPQADERTINARHCAALCSVGIPMGLQYSITAIGSVILQASVNGLGSGAVAAITAGARMSMFFCPVFDALGTTMATYGGQNTGALKFDRLKAGVRDSMIIASIYSVAVFFLFLLAGQYFIMLFVSGSETKIIQDAKLFLVANASCYILLAAVNIYRFMIQGMGFSVFAILAGVMEMIARALMGMYMVPHFGFISACLGSPFAWVLADIFLIPAFYWCLHRLRIMHKGSAV
ncbi:MAG: MATE family efflux transporter [Treponema sp.]|nr:MATE family efflux transporter [Treponema sp.]